MANTTDQDLAKLLRAIAQSVQPTITRNGNTLEINIDGNTYVLQRKVSRATRSQGVKSR